MRDQLYADPLFGLTLTVGIYAAAVALNRPGSGGPTRSC